MNAQPSSHGDLPGAPAGARPRVSIGLPVYNGEEFLVESLDSLLAQTFTDFEILVSDNASTDRTEQICREYAQRDSRIRYYRNPSNIGGTSNHNRVVELSAGEYFAWGAHDDMRAPEFLERCVAVLDARPEIVNCFGRTQVIDGEGKPLERTRFPLDMSSSRARDRFREMIRMDHRIDPAYGLIRAGILRRTGLVGPYADSDRVLQAELALYGPFYELPEYLLFRREHPAQSTKLYPSRQARTAWCDPAAEGTLVLPYLRQFLEYLRVVARVPLGWRERIACFALMLRWLRVNRSAVRDDVVEGVKSMVRPLFSRLGVLSLFRRVEPPRTSGS